MTTSDNPATAVVHLDGQTHTVSWPRGEVARRPAEKGIEASIPCRGHCSACATTVVRGEVEMETNDVLEPDDLADGLILACQSHPVSDEVEVTYD